MVGGVPSFPCFCRTHQRLLHFNRADPVPGKQCLINSIYCSCARSQVTVNSQLLSQWIFFFLRTGWNDKSRLWVLKPSYKTWVGSSRKQLFMTYISNLSDPRWLTCILQRRLNEAAHLPWNGVRTFQSRGRFQSLNEYKNLSTELDSTKQIIRHVIMTSFWPRPFSWSTA